VESLASGTRRIARGGSAAWAHSGLGFATRSARLLVRPDAGAALCTAIDAVADYASAAERYTEIDAERLHDESCRALGYIGQHLPTVFRQPADPDHLLVPDALRYDSVDPVAHLYEALGRVKEQTIDPPATDRDALVWRDAVMVTTQALISREQSTYKDGRLEHDILSGLFLLSALGAEAARSGDERHATMAAYSLDDLADASAGLGGFRELGQDIAMALTEIGIFAVANGLKTLDGRPLDDWVAESLVNKLAGHLPHAMHEALVAGRFEPVDHLARWTFIKQVGVKAESSFGMGFDAATGDDRPFR
jgi:hypothetical protein